MKIVEETTDWGAHSYVPNHIYVLDDSMTKAIAYVPAGTQKVVRFSKPMGFDRAGRTFRELPSSKPAQSSPNSITVEGSRGKSYTLTRDDQGVIRCTCEGFLYRQQCRHLAQYPGS